MKKKSPPERGPLFKGAPNKRPRGRRRFSTGEFESSRSGGLSRAAGPKTPDAVVISDAKGTKLTRKTRAGIMARLHAEAVDTVARERDAKTTALVRDLRTINDARSQPFGPPVEQIEEVPVLVLTPEQKATQLEHYLAYRAAQNTADEALGPYKLKIKTSFRNPKRKKPRNLVLPHGRAEVRVLDAAGNVIATKPGRQPRGHDNAAGVEAVERNRRARAWAKLVRPEGVSDQDWDLLRLVERGPLKPGDAAARLGLKPEVARKRLQRLREKLKP